MRLTQAVARPKTVRQQQHRHPDQPDQRQLDDVEEGEPHKASSSANRACANDRSATPVLPRRRSSPRRRPAPPISVARQCPTIATYCSGPRPCSGDGRADRPALRRADPPLGRSRREDSSARVSGSSLRRARWPAAAQPSGNRPRRLQGRRRPRCRLRRPCGPAARRARPRRTSAWGDPGFGLVIGGTENASSPLNPRGIRLVVSTRSRGHLVSSTDI